MERNNFDSQKVLRVRAGFVRRANILRLDAGDIEEIVATDGLRLDFVSHGDNIIRVMNFENETNNME
eukprot:CAMPEP_0201529980 /NCGR_PEP_ID=MMETSP0161_2-20130828/43373_1 /ASSEMBLY_ACC=CAM_ASM_000251 /TAXON_ID=180227 /ORGANISM="Neoparamoeba aestuarina, Strain SoJaBio B1-5/56/2" /LENGTH=66 /DNA_ID=CAMNT_0047932071 /DNA_START=603 /DNA_END=803 /DNA_ORIENTATION=-